MHWMEPVIFMLCLEKVLSQRAHKQ